MSDQQSWLKKVTVHPQLANLIMFLMILSGVWAMQNLNTQYFPSFSINEVDVSVDWTGASTQELESGVVIPLEKALTGMAYSNGLESVIRTGNATLSVEFNDQVDLQDALNRVRNRVDGVKNWPAGAETPIISIGEEFEPVLQLSLTGPDWLQLRQLALEFENELLDLGIARVEKFGMADLELVIQPRLNLLQQYGLSLQQVVEQIRAVGKDYPAGIMDSGQQVLQLRMPAKPRSLQEAASLPIRLNDGQIVELQELATLEYLPAEGQPLAFPQGKPGIVLAAYRFGTSSMIDAAKAVDEWYLEIQGDLPEGISLVSHNPVWQQVSERLNLLLANGAIGLFLILVVLYLFLNRQIAFWVALGIPAAFSATLALLWFAGGSLNIISMFAMLMALGIIVDDSVVVGEAAYSRLQSNAPAEAVKLGAQKMFRPVLFSSLTTMAAFLPLMLLTDTIGAILFSIPLVIIGMLLASMLECFAVLPGHLYHSLKSAEPERLPAFKQGFQNQFERFKEKILLPLIRLGIRHCGLTVLIAVFLLAKSVFLVQSGIIGFDFFPADNQRTVVAALRLQPDLPAEKRYEQLLKLETALNKADELADSVVQYHVLYMNGRYLGEDGTSVEPTTVSIMAELLGPERRAVTNDEFKRYWRQAFEKGSEVLSLSIDELSDGPPDPDLAIELSGGSYPQLKEAAEMTKQFLSDYPGLTNLDDDLPWGRPELQLSLLAKGRSLGLDEATLSQQLYEYMSGATAEQFYLKGDQVELRIKLPANQRDLASLSTLPVTLPTGSSIQLGDVASMEYVPGFDSLVRFDGHSAIQVTASVNSNLTNEVLLYEEINQKLAPKLSEEFGINLEFGGEDEREERTFADLGGGLVLAMFMIYALLVLFCSSWVWPLLIMVSIPLGVSGAILGHWVLGINMTLLSLFGFFGLAGILVNGAIILIAQYREYRELEASAAWAMELACEKRIRPVLITVFTTIAGLLPILFSVSEQAVFLKPMAASIVFGLLFGSLLVLVLIPSLVVKIENSFKAD